MISTGLARALVDAAARRWPAESEVHREWLAEVDFLATQGRQSRMLWFAAGLAFARPASAPAIGINWRTVGTTFYLLAGPLLLAALAAGMMVAVQVLFFAKDEWQYLVFLWALFASIIGLAVFMGRWRGARSVVTGPMPLAVVLTLSITTTMALPKLLQPSQEVVTYHELLTGITVWPPLLFGLLFFVARAAQNGRGRRAVIVAVMAWLVILDFVIIVEFLPRVGGGQRPIPGFTGIPLGIYEADDAPMWFIYALTGQDFGVLSDWVREDLLDDLIFMPHLLVLFGVYALSYVARASRLPGLGQVDRGV